MASHRLRLDVLVPRNGAVRHARLTAERQPLVYHEFGILGRPPNTDRRALINTPVNVVRRQCVWVIHWSHPKLVVTLEPEGSYGHPAI